MKPQVKQVKAIGKYQIEVNFHDGVHGIFDLQQLAGKGVFKWWDEADNFYKVHLNEETGSIEWNDDIDIDTLNVYLKLRGIDFQQWQRLNQTTYAPN